MTEPDLSDEERLLLVGRVGELTLNKEQLSILSDKAMNCERGDADFNKLKMLDMFWRRHGEGLVSLANFHKQVNKACGLLEQQTQQQPQGQQGGASNTPLGGSPVPTGAAGSGGGGSIGGGGGAASGGGSAAGNGASHVSEESMEDNVTVMELDENGVADIGDDDDHDSGDGGGGDGAEHDAEPDADDADSDNVDPAIKKIVDEHIKGGFFEPRRWKTAKSLVCPGDGYWKDDHRIQEFRTSTAADLKDAKPRPAPTYIARNPFCAQVPKRFFDYNMVAYSLCKKVAVSSEGEIFRATDKEIDQALKEEKDNFRLPPGIASADMYVKVVREARRRHLKVVREARRRHLVDQQAEEEEEEEEEDMEDDATEVEFNQKCGGDYGDSNREEEEEEEEEEENDDAEGDGEGNRADRKAINEIVDEYEKNGFLERCRWRQTSVFKRPGEGYWRDDHDDHRIEMFRDATAADLKKAKPRHAPVYIGNNRLCPRMPKEKYKKQLRMYYLCRKVAVSFDGKLFRATNKEIQAALKVTPDVPAGLSAETYVKVVQEMRRRQYGEEEEEEEEEADSSRHGKRRRV